MHALCWSVADITSAEGCQVMLIGTSSVLSNSLDYFFQPPQEIQPESTAAVYI